jgi:general secretion pathway protein N
MKPGLWVVAAVVFTLTLVLNVPAAFVARFIDWPAAWQPQAISGTLWSGRMNQLGAIGPLSWELRPWLGRGDISGGFQRQVWDLHASGWPWAWQMQLVPAAPMVTPVAAYMLDGRWQGKLVIQGRGAHCSASEGELRGEDMALLVPWTVVLGSARLQLACGDAVKLLATVQRAGEHQFEANLQPFARRVEIKGRVAAEASVTPLLVQAGLMKAGETRFEKVFGGR